MLRVEQLNRALLCDFWDERERESSPERQRYRKECSHPRIRDIIRLAKAELITRRTHQSPSALTEREKKQQDLTQLTHIMESVLKKTHIEGTFTFPHIFPN